MSPLGHELQRVKAQASTKSTHIERLSPIGKLIYICYSGTEEP